MSANTNTQLQDALPPRAVARFTEAQTTWEELVLPAWARRVIISPVTNACSVIITSEPGVGRGDTYTGTENFETIAADAKYSIPLSDGKAKQKCRVFTRVAASTVLEIAIEQNPGG